MANINEIRLSTLFMNELPSSEELSRHPDFCMPAILIIEPENYSDQNALLSLCRDLRMKYSHGVLQLLLKSGFQPAGLSEGYIKAGIDGVIACDDIDVYITRHRMNIYRRFEDEIQFYRETLYEEELLASEVLHEKLHLEHKYRKIEIKKSELETAHRKLLDEIRFDSLTGLLNRKSIFAMIEVEIERAVRIGFPISMLMIDIDYFKHVNDTFGHQFGDQALSVTGRVLQSGLRKYDHAGRYGGEEFISILPNTTKEQAFRIAERFRSTLEKMKIEFQNERTQITASIGIVEWKKGTKKETWISEADAALYEAKRLGRNRSVIK
jgi:diguanylate cyclase (GGDEF)-like protein